MEIEGKISHTQTAFLVFGSAMGNIIYTFTDVASITGRPFWVAVLIGVLLNIPFAVWILYLGFYKQGGTLFDLLEESLGKLICKCVIILYIAINVAASVGMLNMFVGTIKVFFLPRTPSFIILLMIILMCTIFACGELKYLVRLVVLLGALAIANYFIGFSTSFFKDFRLEYVTPVFDCSYAQFIKGTLVTAGNDAECLLLLMVAVESIPHTSKHYLAVVKGIFTWSIVLSVAILIMEGIVGQELLSSVAEAGITVASVMQIASFLSGLEIFILITYQYLAVLKTTIILYCCWAAAKKLFHVPRGKPLLFLSSLAVFAASMWMNSYNKGFFFSIFLGNYVIPPFVLITLLLGTISVFIKKLRDGKNAK